MIRALSLLLLLALPARGQEALVAALSQDAVEVTTGFTGAQLMVFGSTDQPIGPGGDEVLVVAQGPNRPVVVRRKVPALGFLWVNGPSARFAEVPGFYFIAGTRPAWQLLPEEQRQRHSLGLDSLRLVSTGARHPRFRAALLDLEKRSGLWVEDTHPVEVAGSRLFHARLPLPAGVPTGDYRVQVLLIRSRQVVARQTLDFRVDRVGTADRIATVAEDQPFLYGIACIFLAALAGWVGSVVFRRS
ncbi:TIGR02186 family protein [Siccirubricoccus phaeus]|uniref:TIGR02186 family protein n=1 Tax=Siccirubricoccus phaeus TaxID=2595053 RepID=UPI00165C63EA|nr:TIGR02186 family protein [Siccirubricoccus phaeus]